MYLWKRISVSLSEWGLMLSELLHAISYRTLKLFFRWYVITHKKCNPLYNKNRFFVERLLFYKNAKWQIFDDNQPSILHPSGYSLSGSRSRWLSSSAVYLWLNGLYNNLSIWTTTEQSFKALVPLVL